ncbi:hypothetical protein LTR94_037470, partial [Friedmanniomyces endolithicus]
DRSGRRQGGRRRAEPDGPEARHRSRCHRGGRRSQGPCTQHQRKQRNRSGRHHLGERRHRSRSDSCGGDGKGRQRRCHH